MLGAIIGDIVGSTREWNNVKNEVFYLLPQGSRFTDDTVMTLAVARWLMEDPDHRPETLVESMQDLGRRYPGAGYGGMFSRWLMEDNPRPYGSFGNGSAMRVSPVGLYANTLDEALELARITALVSHDHPEGIKGAQAIAAAVFLHKNCLYGAAEKTKSYIEKTFGYNLDLRLEDIRDSYSFDVTCQGSVPIAIMAYLQRSSFPAERALRLAISMGGDSDTIGAMTCSIACAYPFSVIGGGMPREVVERCRALLPPDLLEINDRFEAFISRPLYQSYKVMTPTGLFFAGEYPGDKDERIARRRIERMVHFGIRHFIDLTEEGELRPYSHLLPEECSYHRFPIRDVGAPETVESVHSLLRLVDNLVENYREREYVYIHCWGGVGRTGTIVACNLARVIKDPTMKSVINSLRSYFKAMPKSSGRTTPESQEQVDFIGRFVESLPAYEAERVKRVKDRIRGCLVGGAVGDALGYAIEFDRLDSIVSRFGQEGLSRFILDGWGKALVSDDTQMTLFTAVGMLMGVTRGYMRGIGGEPEKYVDGAYIDWYHTQTGKIDDIEPREFHYTWLRNVPAMYRRRAPGNTCMDACERLRSRKRVENNSKGCGGIMRVAPMACLMAGYASRKETFYGLARMSEAGAETARVTHKHPLGFLPAAMLTHLLYRLMLISADKAPTSIAGIAREAIEGLDGIYRGEFAEEKEALASLTRRALSLAESDIDDRRAISMLGEGWTGDEAWAIALYCAVRHVDSIRDAIVAAVNHDGDSDSTGSICGNIMGAIYGYEAIREQRLFCSYRRPLEETLELHDIIMAVADDLATSCIISEYAPVDTPAKRQWLERYCYMKPSGIKL